MRFYWPIAKVDGEQRMVWGYATTETEDDQGEIVTREALARALEGYMRFANIREMHQNSAVGVAREAELDDKGLYLGAKIVDDEAWRKVVEGVYNGFSIGGRVTARDPADRRLITGLTLTEISVVDRPANPDAVFDCWKLAAAPCRAPVQIWDCGITEHRHAAKAEAVRCTESSRTADENSELRENTAAAGGDIDRGGPPAVADAAASVQKNRPVDTRLSALSPHLQTMIAELYAQIGELLAGDEAAGDLAATALARTLRKARRADLAPLADGLAELAGAIVPRLDALQQRVEEIARTPLPPQTLARGFAALAKREDGSPLADTGDVVTALARMSEEERTLALIKAAHANPIRR